MTTQNNSEMPTEILVVEDNPGDVRLFLTQIKVIATESNFHVQKNGEEALKFLHQKGEYANATRPDLIVLDLQLPKKSGMEILTEIGKDESLSEIPVVIFSSLPSQKEILENCERIPPSHLYNQTG